MRLGFVGTGTMGAPMALCLIDAGHELTVCDVRPAATAPLAARGAHEAGSPAEVARHSEVVFTSLPGPREVEHAVLDSAAGILAGLAVGGAYIDMTTNAPAVARRIAEVCSTRGVDMLDAPVSGRPPTMTVMAGGDPAVFAKYRPLLAAMAGNIFHVGEAGAGCVAKLVTQYLGYTNFVAALEGLLIGAKAGIDLAQLARIVPLSAGAPIRVGEPDPPQDVTTDANSPVTPSATTTAVPTLIAPTDRRVRCRATEVPLATAHPIPAVVDTLPIPASVRTSPEAAETAPKRASRPSPMIPASGPPKPT